MTRPLRRATGAIAARPSLAALLPALLIGACGTEARHAPPLPLRVQASVVAAQPPHLEPRADTLLREDVVIAAGRPAPAQLVAAGIPHDVVDALDEAFVGRIDLAARLVGGGFVSVWTRDGELVAARVSTSGGAPLLIGRYDGALAPSGFYDERGNAMTSPIRSRPIALSRITSRFGTRFDSLAGRHAQHQGIDYGVPIGTEVIAVGDGIVKHVGASAKAGTFVTITHAAGYESRYLHLSTVAPALRPGTLVKQAQVIARSGNTGRSTGPHLHYELRVAGIPLDPLVTLPLPAVALGPMARREHLAFLNQLEAHDDGRADEQDEHP